MQNVIGYKSQFLKATLLLESASIMANTQSQQNSANDLQTGVINKPGVAGVVLQKPLSLID